MNGVGVWLRRVALGLLLAVLTFAALTARVVSDGETELGLSDVAFNRGDLREAVLHARRAAVLYAPGAPHVPAAYARLQAVARGGEAKGDVDIAKAAFGAMRGAALETRHVFTPHAAELLQADTNLARLASPSDPALRERAAAFLGRDEAPAPGWVLVLGAGFALFAAGLVVFSLRGVSPSGGLSPRGAWVAVALSLAGAACWTLAVYRA